MATVFKDGVVTRDGVNQGIQQNVMESREAFNRARGITETNPYGTQGFFSRVFGIDPSKISYESNIPLAARQQIASGQYDKFINPYNVAGQPGYMEGAGGDISQGIVRSGIPAGTETTMGTVQDYRQPMSAMDIGAAGLGSLLVPMAGPLIERGTRVKGMEGSPPVIEGQQARPLSQGIMGQALDMFTGGAAGQTGRLLDKVSSKADEIINRGSSVEAGEQQLRGGITGTPTQQAPVEPIPGAFEVSDVTSLTNNPQVQSLRRLAEDYLSEDRGFKIRGGAPSGSRYQLNVNPVGPDRGARFDFRMPLQDLGIGNLFSQNMDPSRAYNVTTV